MKSLLAGAGISDRAAPLRTPAPKTQPTRSPEGAPRGKGHHPNTAPAYYLGRPASFWITRS